jgi:3-oxoacyl-[acyl-carrier-protein] synthase II
MFPKRLAITGIGVVSPAGLGIETFWEAIVSGQSFLGPIDGFETANFTTAIAGELKDFSARSFVPKGYRKAVKVMARDIEIAVAAADLAVKDAGLVTAAAGDGAQTTYPLNRMACNIGAGLICSDLNELGAAVTTAVVDGKFNLKLWGSAGMNNLTPLWLLKYLPNMLSCHVTIIHGTTGPSNTLTCGAAASLMAVGEAGYGIAEGRADAAIAGGAESKVNPMGLLRQDLLGRLCRGERTCRPFDENHTGTVIGEAGGLLILEELAAAQTRQARIYAELIGFGAASI